MSPYAGLCPLPRAHAASLYLSDTHTLSLTLSVALSCARRRRSLGSALSPCCLPRSVALCLNLPRAIRAPACSTGRRVQTAYQTPCTGARSASRASKAPRTQARPCARRALSSTPLRWPRCAAAAGAVFFRGRCRVSWAAACTRCCARAIGATSRCRWAESDSSRARAAHRPRAGVFAAARWRVRR